MWLGRCIRSLLYSFKNVPNVVVCGTQDIILLLVSSLLTVLYSHLYHWISFCWSLQESSLYNTLPVPQDYTVLKHIQLRHAALGYLVLYGQRVTLMSHLHVFTFLFLSVNHFNAFDFSARLQHSWHIHSLRLVSDNFFTFGGAKW